MNQPFCLFVPARYATCLMWNMSITIFQNGYSGDGVMVMGSHSGLVAMVAQIEQFALKLRIDAFMPGQ